MDLSNKCILVKVKDTKEFQRKVFLKHGVIWNSGDIDVMQFYGEAESYIVFFISSDKRMTYGSFGSEKAEQIKKEIETKKYYRAENFKFIIYDDNKLEDKKTIEVE